MILDAYRALALLASHPAIDRNRIAVDGVLRIFHGLADDWTPVGPCREYVERLTRAGVDAKVHEFGRRA